MSLTLTLPSSGTGLGFLCTYSFVYTKSAEWCSAVLAFPRLGLAVLIALVRKYPPLKSHDGYKLLIAILDLTCLQIRKEQQCDQTLHFAGSWLLMKPLNKAPFL